MYILSSLVRLKLNFLWANLVRDEDVGVYLQEVNTIMQNT